VGGGTDKIAKWRNGEMAKWRNSENLKTAIRFPALSALSAFPAFAVKNGK
jgi:hypothetical protein